MISREVSLPALFYFVLLPSQDCCPKIGKTFVCELAGLATDRAGRPRLDNSRTKVIQALRLVSRGVRRIYFILLASQDKSLSTGKTFGCVLSSLTASEIKNADG